MAATSPSEMSPLLPGSSCGDSVDMRTVRRRRRAAICRSSPDEAELDVSMSPFAAAARGLGFRTVTMKEGDGGLGGAGRHPRGDVALLGRRTEPPRMERPGW